MKILLFFNINGIHEEIMSNVKDFNISNFPDFKRYTEYPGFVVLYNDSNERNSVTLPFTTDVFNGDIMVLKINKDNKMASLPIGTFVRLLGINKVAKFEDYSSDSSDDDPFSNSCNLRKSEC